MTAPNNGFRPTGLDQGGMIPLRDYIEQRLVDLEKALTREREARKEGGMLFLSDLDRRFTDMKEANTLASNALDARMLHMNEWRAGYETQRSEYPTRIEVEDKLLARQAAERVNSDRIQALDLAKVNSTSHDNLEKRMGSMEKHLANIEGRMWAIGVGLTIITTAISIGIHFIH